MILEVAVKEPVVVTGALISLETTESDTVLLVEQTEDISLTTVEQVATLVTVANTEVVATIEQQEIAIDVAPNVALKAKFDRHDLTEDTYYYYGGLQANGEWIINRWDKTTLTKTTATESNNPAYASIGAAWAAKTLLSYV